MEAGRLGAAVAPGLRRAGDHQPPRARPRGGPVGARHDKDMSNYEKYVERNDLEPAMAAGTSDEWADIF